MIAKSTVTSLLRSFRNVTASCEGITVIDAENRGAPGNMESECE